MPNTYEDITRRVTVEAAADLSTHQHRVVELNSTHEQAALAAANQGYGVLKNKPQANEAASVAIEGIARVQTGGAVTRGDLVKVNTGGLVVSVTSGAAHAATFRTLGRCLLTAASGTLTAVELNRETFVGVSSGAAII